MSVSFDISWGSFFCVCVGGVRVYVCQTASARQSIMRSLPRRRSVAERGRGRQDPAGSHDKGMWKPVG